MVKLPLCGNREAVSAPGASLRPMGVTWRCWAGRQTAAYGCWRISECGGARRRVIPSSSEASPSKPANIGQKLQRPRLPTFWYTGCVGALACADATNLVHLTVPGFFRKQSGVRCITGGKSPCIKLSRNSPTASRLASNLRNDAPASQIWRLD